MTPYEDPGLASQLAEHVLHGKVKAIVKAESIEYADALERIWYASENGELVETYRAYSSDDEDPEADETLSPFDAGIEVGKRVRAYLSAHETNPEAAVNAVLAADAALKDAWDADLVDGTN